MNIEAYNKIAHWYDDYTRPYLEGVNGVPDSLRLKQAHIARVVIEMDSLTSALGLDESQCLIARTIALLHDIGRYEQLVRWGTMSDRASVSHSELGIAEIKKHNSIGHLSGTEERIIFAGILNHSRREIEPNLDEATEFNCKLIRDADKLDIYKVFIEVDMGDNEALKMTAYLDLPEEVGVSDKVINDLESGKLVDYVSMQNRHDVRLMLLSWVYDLNFDYTRAQILERGYFNILSEGLKHEENAKQALERLELELRTREIAKGLKEA